MTHKDAGAFHILEAKLTQVEFGKPARQHANTSCKLYIIKKIKAGGTPLYGL